MSEYEGDIWEQQLSDFDQWCHKAWQAELGQAGEGEFKKKNYKILMKYV